MQIYFLAPFADTEDLKLSYSQIIDTLKEKKHKVLYEETEIQNFKEYYINTVNKIKHADAVFSEVSSSTANMGYEIAYALSISLPVYVFYKQGLAAPSILAGCDNKNLHLMQYKESNIKEIVERAAFDLQEAKQEYVMVPMSPLVKKYLDWVSFKKAVSKSTFIRSLIEAKILKDKEFKKDYS
jgi:hypothetical protein